MSFALIYALVASITFCAAGSSASLSAEQKADSSFGSWLMSSTLTSGSTPTWQETHAEKEEHITQREHHCHVGSPRTSALG
jgi:hypothetical protein